MMENKSQKQDVSHPVISRESDDFGQGITNSAQSN